MQATIAFVPVRISIGNGLSDKSIGFLPHALLFALGLTESVLLSGYLGHISGMYSFVDNVCYRTPGR